MEKTDTPHGSGVQYCAEYFKHEYYRYEGLRESDLTMCNDFKRVQITSFHEALYEGNIDFILDVLRQFTDKEIGKFALNALLDYRVKAREQCPIVLLENDDSSDVADAKAQDKMRSEKDTAQAQERYRKLMLSSNPGLCTELPVALVLFSGNEYLLRTLVQEGLQLDAVDSKGNCVFHELVKFSVFNTERALEAVDNVLYLLPDNTAREKLFFTPNSKGIRPVELAAKMARPRMLLKYMNIEGVYRHTVQQCLMFKIVRYNVTHYESPDAKVYKSLLYYLTEADEEELNDFQQCGLLAKEPFNSWIEATFDTQRGTMRFLVWYWILFYALTIDHLADFADGGPSLPVVISILIMALLLLLVEVVHTKNNLREMWYSVESMFKHGKVPVTFTFSYRAIQLIFCAFVIFNVCSAGFFCDAVQFVQITYVMCTFFGVLSILFFLQLKEGVGHLLIVIQKMLYEVFLYSFMFGTFYLAFACSFTLLSPQYGQACVSVNNSTSAVNDSASIAKLSNIQFKSFPRSLYETLLLVLYVMPPTDIYFDQLESPLLTQILYSLLVLIPGLMMVNFLIAIMTRRAEQIDSLKDSILKLEKLSLVLYVQERKKNKVVRWIYEKFHSLYRFLTCSEKCKNYTEKSKCFDRSSNCVCNCLRNYFAPKHSELFQYTRDGQVYLEVVEVTVK